MANIQRPHGYDNHDEPSKEAGTTAGTGVGDKTADQELSFRKNKQLVVKLRYRHQILGAIPSANEDPKPAFDRNVPQNSIPNNGSGSNSSEQDNTIQPHLLHTPLKKDLDVRILQASDNAFQHVEDRVTVPTGPVIQSDDKTGSLDPIIQEPCSSELLETAQSKQHQVSDAVDPCANKNHVMHGLADVESSGHSSTPTTCQDVSDAQKEKEQVNGCHEEPTANEGPYQTETAEGVMGTSLEEIMGQSDNPEPLSNAKDGDQVGRSSTHRDLSMDDTPKGRGQDRPGIDAVNHASHYEEGHSAGESEQSDSQVLENEDSADDADDEEVGRRLEDEVPHRSRISGRANSQALNSALSEAEMWRQKIEELENQRRLVQAATVQYGSQLNTPSSAYQMRAAQRSRNPSAAIVVDPNDLGNQRQQYQQGPYAAPQRLNQRLTGFHPGQPDLPGIGGMTAVNLPGALHPYGVLPQQHMGFQYPGHPRPPFAQMLPGHSSMPYPPQAYDFSDRTPLHFGPAQWAPLRQHTPAYQTNENENVHEQEEQLSDSGSDDDEPLKERVKRHPSIVSHGSGIDSSPPARGSEKKGHHQDQGHASARNLAPATAKPQVQNPVRMQRPLPQALKASEEAATSPPSSPGIGSWKLPVFEVQRQPKEDEDDGPLVKVSIPNLVREELLLSPDHADQEVHLLLNIFVPGQQALAAPDPEPAVAVLNFHTIAIMVVEAFVQFEIGDEFGQGRGHWHGNYNQSDTEYTRLRNAKDASVDEVFFAVVDRWRAGLESKKKNLELIRGVQEFCDVALDVIYYIKEHGLLDSEPEPKPDKGKKRGTKKDQDESMEELEETGKGKGKKRAAGHDVNTVQARKKVKTEKKGTHAKGKGKAKTTTKSKSKSTPGITVIVKKRG